MDEITTAQPQQDMDVSRKTVLVMLVITIMVVALGVWTVLDNIEYASPVSSKSSQSNVALVILPSEAAGPGAPETGLA